MDLSGKPLSHTSRRILLIFAIFCLVGIILFLIQVPRYYREVADMRQQIALTSTAQAILSPTPPPTLSPTPSGTASASPLRCGPTDMFFLLALMAALAYFILRKRR